MMGKIITYWRWILLASLGVLIGLAPIPSSTPTPVDRSFQVEASSFNYSPAILRANPGDRITIQLVAKDVVHGILVDSYGVEIQADPGQSRSITFIANRSGTYRLRCSVTCGALHPFMIGKLQVSANLLLWRGEIGRASCRER